MRTLAAILFIPLVVTTDRQRAEASRCEWREEDGEYVLTVLGLLNGLLFVTGRGLTVTVDEGLLPKRWRLRLLPRWW
jgi:hypothetical protein